MLFFLASAAIGFAMAWIFLQEKLKKTAKLHSTLKDSMDRLVDEYSEYKVAIDNNLAEKDEEMLRLNQQLRHNQNMAESRYNKAYNSLQERVNQLKVENEHLKASAIKKKDAINLINDLKRKLAESKVKLKKQDSLLMQAKSEAFPSDNSMVTLGYKNEISKLNDKIDKLKKFSPSDDINKLLFINKKLKKKIKETKGSGNQQRKAQG